MSLEIERVHGNWVGHPEADAAENGRIDLICWTSNEWRAYEPTEKTRRWVYASVDGREKLPGSWTLKRVRGAITRALIAGDVEDMTK